MTARILEFAKRLPRKPDNGLTDAAANLGGLCALVIVTTANNEPERRRRAKQKLFHAALSMTLRLMDDPDVDLEGE